MNVLLIGSLAASGMPAEWLAGALVANPVDAARVLGVLALEPDLYLLGPAGAYIAARFSQEGAAALLLAALAFWTTVPVVCATIRFALPKRGRRGVATQALSSAKEVRCS